MKYQFWIRILGGFLLCVITGASAGGIYFYVLFKSPIGRNPGTNSTFLIPRGTPFSVVTQRLKEQDLLPHPRLYRYLSRYLDVQSRIRAGEFELQHHWNTWQLLKHLTSGKSVLHRVTIPEGRNFASIAETLEAHQLVDKTELTALFKDPELLRETGVPDAVSLEGFLFPETYFFSKIDSPRKILETMIAQYRQTFTSAYKKRASALGLTAYEALILASMIEKETGASEDRPKIAAVFHNRLKRRMRLDSDPTVIYGLKDFNGNLTRKHLRTPTPYNTYRRYGLPPTPICSPGRDSLYSALFPAEEQYLFFVARGDGSSQFSTSLREHNKAVSYYQKNRRVRRQMRRKLKERLSSSTL